MNERYFRDYHLFLDQQPDLGGTARLAEHAEQRAASTRKNLLLEAMAALAGPASGEACTTKVQFSANYSLVQLFRFAIATMPFCRSRFRLARRHERSMR